MRTSRPIRKDAWNSIPNEALIKWARQPAEREAMRKAKRWLDRARKQADDWLGNVEIKVGYYAPPGVVMVKHLRSVILSVAQALDVEGNPKLRAPIGAERKRNDIA